MLAKSTRFAGLLDSADFLEVLLSTGVQRNTDVLHNELGGHILQGLIDDAQIIIVLEHNLGHLINHALGHLTVGEQNGGAAQAIHILVGAVIGADVTTLNISVP